MSVSDAAPLPTEKVGKLMRCVALIHDEMLALQRAARGVGGVGVVEPAVRDEVVADVPERLAVHHQERGQVRQAVARGGVVDLEVESVRAAGIGLGGTLARAVSQQINPVVDLTDEDLPLRVTSVRVAEGALVMEATGDPTGMELRRAR